MQKRAEFLRIQNQGERVDTRHFVLILARQLAEGRARLGITASRKIGNAVIRNRAKRLVREAFRATPELWPAGFDLVVIVRKPLGEVRLAAVVEEWLAASRTVRRKLEKLARLAPEPAGAKTGRGA